MNRPVVRQIYSDISVVYSHWLDEQCFYVGSGKLKRPYERADYQRSREWFDTVGDRFDEVYVKIEKVFVDRNSAYDYEEELTMRMIDDGYKLSNKYYGRKMSENARIRMIDSLKGNMVGERNAFYGRHHTQESIDKMLKNMPDKSGVNHFRFGKHLDDKHKNKLSKSKTGPRDLIEATYPDGTKKRFDGYNKAGKEIRCSPDSIRQNVKSNGYYQHPRTKIEFRMITKGCDRPIGDRLESTTKEVSEANKKYRDKIKVTTDSGDIFIAYGYKPSSRGTNTCPKKIKKELGQIEGNVWKNELTGYVYEFIRKGVKKNG